MGNMWKAQNDRQAVARELASAERGETRRLPGRYYPLAGEDADWTGVSMRTANALRREGFVTPQAAARLSDAALLLIDGFGKKGLQELREYMQGGDRLLDTLRASVEQVEARKTGAETEAEGWAHFTCPVTEQGFHDMPEDFTLRYQSHPAPRVEFVMDRCPSCGARHVIVFQQENRG
jgi:hypothetical protein